MPRITRQMTVTYSLHFADINSELVVQCVFSYNPRLHRLSAKPTRLLHGLPGTALHGVINRHRRITGTKRTINDNIYHQSWRITSSLPLSLCLVLRHRTICECSTRTRKVTDSQLSIQGVYLDFLARGGRSQC